MPDHLLQTFTITLTLLFVYKAVTVYFGHYGVSVSAVFRQLYEAEPAGTSFEEIQGSARPLQLSLNSVSASRHIGGLLLLGGCVALCIELLATDTVRKCYLTLRQRSRLPTSDRKA
uniref:MARVEL domain-containing protein n=1 Tax=Steinernema glaseri TaxID=37863 RepID=A0A1I7ZCV2_9BILA